MKKITLFLIFGLFFVLQNSYSKEFNSNWRECYTDKYFKNTKFKGQPHGRADCFLENGDVYSGFFNRGVANGAISIRGPITKEHEFGKLKFVGNFKNNQPDSGSYFFENGSEFDGNFKTIRKPHSFTGDFKNNKPWNGFVYWYDPFERRIVTEGKISSVNLGTISPKMGNTYNINNDETGFGITLLLVLGIFITVLFFKFSNIKKTKKSKNKISRGTKQSELFITNSLPVVFWGFFIGGNIFFNMIMHFSKDEFLGFLLLIHFIWITFSVYLIFRNAEIFKQQKIKNKENYGQATAAKIATVLIVLAGIGNLMMTMRNL